MNRILRAVVVGAAASLLVVGCSQDEPRPKMAPPTESVTPPEPPSSLSPDPSPTETVQPRGPVETVRAWIEAQNTALMSGDLSDVRRLSARSCDTCEQLVDPIGEVYEAGGRFLTKGWVVEAAKLRDSSVQAEEVDAAITIMGGRTFASAESEPVVYSEDKRIVRFELVREGGQRVVSHVGFLS